MNSPSPTNPSAAHVAKRSNGGSHEPRPLALMGLMALGIVFGDIGTSPLYAFRVAVQAVAGSGGATEAQVLGVLSLIIWSLVLIISVKYVLFVMRADNHGEGGILALLALVRTWSSNTPRRGDLLITLGLFGAALLYGDGVITPAISVMSAVEGLTVATHAFEPYVKPLTIAILLGLFAVQYKGTAKIARLFGPVMLLWFAVIAGLGVAGIVSAPQVLRALNPGYALGLFDTDRWTVLMVFGAVFLAVTGGEALYADMGHVGRRPIRMAWCFVVLPALVLNYAGQAALILTKPGETENLFFHLAPDALVIPLVVLATAATVIASQALISGVFSLTRQACQLGLWPRLHIVQTSSEGYGQIYVPMINWALAAMTVVVALVFKTSDDLAAAYGVAVSGTMLITAVLLYEAMTETWRWPRPLRVGLSLVFVLVDGAFLFANLLKLPDGGWLPLVGGVAVFLLMAIWQKGCGITNRHLEKLAESLPDLMAHLKTGKVSRVPGTGVFIAKTSDDLPPALRRHLRHNPILQEQVFILSIHTAEVPRLPAKERLQVKSLGMGVWRVQVRYGFMQVPNLPVALRGLALLDQAALTNINTDEVAYYVGHERIIPVPDNPAMQGLEEFLFAFMARNAADPADYFNIPETQVMEVGVRIEI